MLRLQWPLGTMVLCQISEYGSRDPISLHSSDYIYRKEALLELMQSVLTRNWALIFLGDHQLSANALRG